MKARRECVKRAYRSERAAKAAHRNAHFRIRVYRCPDCRWLHVTHEPKERTS